MKSSFETASTGNVERLSQGNETDGSEEFQGSASPWKPPPNKVIGESQESLSSQESAGSPPTSRELHFKQSRSDWEAQEANVSSDENKNVFAPFFSTSTSETNSGAAAGPPPPAEQPSHEVQHQETVGIIVRGADEHYHYKFNRNIAFLGPYLLIADPHNHINKQAVTVQRADQPGRILGYVADEQVATLNLNGIENVCFVHDAMLRAHEDRLVVTYFATNIPSAPLAAVATTTPTAAKTTTPTTATTSTGESKDTAATVQVQPQAFPTLATEIKTCS